VECKKSPATDDKTNGSHVQTGKKDVADALANQEISSLTATSLGSGGLPSKSTNVVTNADIGDSSSVSGAVKFGSGLSTTFPLFPLAET
jgi:hypothetical protein